MVKAYKKAPVEFVYVVEMSEKEATALRDTLGSLSSGDTYSVFDKLDDALQGVE